MHGSPLHCIGFLFIALVSIALHRSFFIGIIVVVAVVVGIVVVVVVVVIEVVVVEVVVVVALHRSPFQCMGVHCIA